MTACPPQTIRVTLDDQRGYDILAGHGLLADCGTIIRENAGLRQIFVVRDAQVDVHAATLDQSLRAAGFAPVFITLPEGETAKTWPHLIRTVDTLLDARADRHALVVALGGGVTGDHAGFAASITLRGLDYIQIPTTLLAQVDSSVGGKTGINTAQGKNLVGSFCQPRLVVIDPAELDTLPDRQMRAGYGETVKYAFINDPAFFTWLETNGEKLLARDPAALTHAIATSCAAKAAIVMQDEHEAGPRALLNFGHTFGHALEAVCGFDRRLLHGEGVSIGMALAFDVSVAMGLCPAADATRATTHLRRMGLPTRIADIADLPETRAQDLIDLMGHDKKNKGGRIGFVLTRGIGHAFTTLDADMGAVARVLDASLTRSGKKLSHGRPRP